MQRYNFYFEQVVTEAELDAGFEAVEQAEQHFAVDHGLFGVTNGLGVGQHGIGDLTVDVAGGTAYDQTGQRISFPATQNCDVSIDHLGAPTAVAVPGNEKWVSVFIKFKRVESDPRIDGHGTPLNYDLAEGWEFYVVQGAEAVIPTAVRPATISDGVLLADIHLINAQVQVLTADIDMQTYPTGRRQDVVTVQMVGRYTQQDGYGHWDDAIEALTSILDTHTSGTDYEHPDTDITSAALIGTPVSWPTDTTLRVHLTTAMAGFNQRCALAWGRISALGVVIEGVNIAAVAHPFPGIFGITMTAPALTGYCVIATAYSAGLVADTFVPHFQITDLDDFIVYITDASAGPPAGKDIEFSFVVIAY